MNDILRRHDQPAAEARLAARMAGVLSTGAQTLPHDVTERLRFSRERALARAREVRQLAPKAAPAAGVVAVTARGAAMLAGPASWWQRAASVLPLLVLAGGLLVINHFATREQVLAAAEIDAQLLADDLPPAAYSDPGFAEYLRSAPNP